MGEIRRVHAPYTAPQPAVWVGEDTDLRRLARVPEDYPELMAMAAAHSRDAAEKLGCSIAELVCWSIPPEAYEDEDGSTRIGHGRLVFERG